MRGKMHASVRREHCAAPKAMIWSLPKSFFLWGQQTVTQLGSRGALMIQKKETCASSVYWVAAQADQVVQGVLNCHPHYAT